MNKWVNPLGEKGSISKKPSIFLHIPMLGLQTSDRLKPEDVSKAEGSTCERLV